MPPPESCSDARSDRRRRHRPHPGRDRTGRAAALGRGRPAARVPRRPRPRRGRGGVHADRGRPLERHLSRHPRRAPVRVAPPAAATASTERTRRHPRSASDRGARRPRTGAEGTCGVHDRHRDRRPVLRHGDGRRIRHQRQPRWTESIRGGSPNRSSTRWPTCTGSTGSPPACRALVARPGISSGRCGVF